MAALTVIICSNDSVFCSKHLYVDPKGSSDIIFDAPFSAAYKEKNP